MIAVIALGSNQGDRLAFLRSALNEINQLKETSVLRKSKIYLTAPEGGVAENYFLNAVIEVKTNFSEFELLKELQKIEKNNQRIRTIRWGDRTLDLDLIDYESKNLESSDLKLPHPLAHERAFVLLPWLELNPEATLVGRGAVRDIVKLKNFSKLEFYSEF